MAGGGAAYAGWGMDRPDDTPEPSEASLSTSAEDIGLRCLSCDYNLTGLAENRCPECNAPFAPDLMRRILAGDRLPVPIWDDPSQGSLLVRFFRVCWMTWFRPTEFARQMPWSFDTRSVIKYWFLVRAVTLLLVVATSLLTVGRTDASSDLKVASAGIILLFAGSLLCEATLAIVLDVLVERRASPQLTEPVGPWRWWGRVSFYSSFLILTAGFWPALWLAEWADRRQLLAFDLAWGAYVWIPAIQLWWFQAVAGAVAAHAARGWRLKVAQALIPVVCLVSLIVVGLFLLILANCPA